MAPVEVPALEAYKTDPPQRLTLIIGGAAVGIVTTSHILPNGVDGMLMPLPALEPYRPLFERTVEMARQLDAFDPGFDYGLYDKLCAEWDKISALEPTFAERTGVIQEFTIWADWMVEAMFWFPGKNADA